MTEASDRSSEQRAWEDRRKRWKVERLDPALARAPERDAIFRTLGEIELAPGDLSQSFYEGTEVDLTPLVYEQVMLALPTRPLCGEECRGLCPQCGINRNSGQCACATEAGDPRWAALRNLKIDRGA